MYAKLISVPCSDKNCNFYPREENRVSETKSPPLVNMALYDTLILVVALAMLLIGLQTFLDKDKRQVASEVIRATFLMVTGLYFLNFWRTEVSLSSTTSNSGSY
jgi:hypothetical protein